jgi:hypothetical protein
MLEADAGGTRIKLCFLLIVCLPTATWLPIDRNGDFGPSPFLGQLSAKQRA